MADWYNNKFDKQNYNLKMAEEILLRADKIEDMEDKDVAYERLEEVYEQLDDKIKSELYINKRETFLEKERKSSFGFLDELLEKI